MRKIKKSILLPISEDELWKKLANAIQQEKDQIHLMKVNPMSDITFSYNQEGVVRLETEEIKQDITELVIVYQAVEQAVQRQLENFWKTCMV